MDKIYGVNMSPAVRKVLLVLETKGVEYERVDVMPFQTPEGYEKIHPLKLIPGYEDGEVTLGDSAVICSYLEEKYPQTPVYPQGRAERHRAMFLERYSDTRLFSLLAGGYFAEKFLAPLVLNRPTNEEKIEKTLSLLPAEFSYLENELQGNFLCGDSLTIADCSVGSLFLNASYAGLTIDAEKWPKLAEYLNRLFETPAFLTRKAEDAALLKLMA